MGKKREGLGHLEEALSIYIEIGNKKYTIIINTMNEMGVNNANILL